MSVAVGQDLGHYRLLEILGEGGMGVVWRALDTRLCREVAVKVLPDRFAGDPVRRARFEREAKAVAALDHPSIVTLHAVEEAEGVVFFTMELVRGETLSGRIRPGGLPFDEILRIALPLCDAVAAAHARGIVHRDLKPANVMVTSSGTVKILDFGLALLRGDPAPGEASTESAPGAFSGTFGYAAPEQLRGERVDHRADLFAVGAILHALATGEPLVPGAAPDDPALVNPGLPPGFGDLLRRCLEKDPSRRIPSAGELKLSLERLRDAPEAAARLASIAVLPFVDRSPARDQAHLGEGIAEEVIASLGRVPGLRVASRSSSFLYRDVAFDTREIAGRLGVSALLEGSVRRAGGTLRVTVHLVDARTDATLWSETYDRGEEDVFGVQEAIARSVVATLHPGGAGAPPARVPTRDVQAYEYWLRGRRFYEQFGRSDIEFALQLFSRAVELDPTFAAAHAGLADCWAYLYRHADPTDAALREADAASRRAVELDPESAPAWAARGTALSIANRDDEAERAFARAEQLDEGLYEAWYHHARHAFAGGRSAQALRLYERAMKARPEDFQAPLLCAQIYDDLGDRDAAASSRRRGIALVEKRLELVPHDARAVYMAANGLVALGETARGLEWADRARGLQPDEPMTLYNLGCIYAMAGRREDALDCLERAQRRGLAQRGWYEHDSNLDSLRDDVRFARLLEASH